MTDYVLDVQAVLEQFKEERFVLFVAGGRGHDAVRLALQNPDRVEALIWAVASVSNSAWPSGMWTTLPNENWKLFLSTLVPRSLSGEERNRRIQEYDDCIRLEDRNTWIRTHSRSDIKNELPRLKAPMLVLHPKDFFGLPVEESMKVTALAANAQFVSVDGEGIRSGDPARGLAATLAAIDSFLASLPPRDSHPTAPASSGAPPDAPSQREIEVLRLVAAGKSNRQIADELILSVRTVERHLSNAYAKLGARGRADAVAWLMRAPLWPSRRARRRRPSRPPPGQPSPCGR